ncbi:unnamed protein product [Natator depressus]
MGLQMVVKMGEPPPEGAPAGTELIPEMPSRRHQCDILENLLMEQTLDTVKEDQLIWRYILENILTGKLISMLVSLTSASGNCLQQNIKYQEKQILKLSVFLSISEDTKSMQQ